LDVLKATLNFAFREGHASTDEAWRRVKPFREASAPKIRYLDQAEARRLVNACEPEFRALAQCALLTGSRHGEIIGFCAGDFDRYAGFGQRAGQQGWTAASRRSDRRRGRAI
jgi:integrase